MSKKSGGLFGWFTGNSPKNTGGPPTKSTKPPKKPKPPKGGKGYSQSL